ncbi:MULTISPECIES: GNAT family N-acetyltransferase [unclassified Azospirillum]|uniref:GNAT family N-acetyltransferase n=1 Tax=unclassified Azospirillum TaxID=2630922 RepID=UPI000B752134|nr:MULTISPECIES: GNAT family N-acetyltransferase [unclassified Azospirillum]SNT06382.1 putative acetyltransferase [Azospirillum sp. RU38E]SNT21408.1 putative acetyltransferase [Azospirillum sp. RU37A]
MSAVETIPSITLADPRSAEALALITALDAYLDTLYPPEENYLLDPDRLAQPDIRFLLARLDGQVVGCGAIRLDPDGYGEIKRMFVQPAWRGRRIAEALLAGLADIARQQGLTRLKLETGPAQQAAVRLYERAGFRPCGPFADYPDNGASLFMQRLL